MGDSVGICINLHTCVLLTLSGLLGPALASYEGRPSLEVGLQIKLLRGPSCTGVMSSSGYVRDQVRRAPLGSRRRAAIHW